MAPESFGNPGNNATVESPVVSALSSAVELLNWVHSEEEVLETTPRSEITHMVRQAAYIHLPDLEPEAEELELIARSAFFIQRHPQRLKAFNDMLLHLSADPNMDFESMPEDITRYLGRFSETLLKLGRLVTSE